MAACICRRFDRLERRRLAAPVEELAPHRLARRRSGSTRPPAHWPSRAPRSARRPPAPRSPHPSRNAARASRPRCRAPASASSTAAREPGTARCRARSSWPEMFPKAGREVKRNPQRRDAASATCRGCRPATGQRRCAGSSGPTGPGGTARIAGTRVPRQSLPSLHRCPAGADDATHPVELARELRVILQALVDHRDVGERRERPHQLPRAMAHAVDELAAIERSRLAVEALPGHRGHQGDGPAPAGGSLARSAPRASRHPPPEARLWSRRCRAVGEQRPGRRVRGCPGEGAAAGAGSLARTRPGEDWAASLTAEPERRRPCPSSHAK